MRPPRGARGGDHLRGFAGTAGHPGAWVCGWMRGTVLRVAHPARNSHAISACSKPAWTCTAQAEVAAMVATSRAIIAMVVVVPRGAGSSGARARWVTWEA